jgi:uncharacterized ferritin-like protein (DUF455 family)
MAWRGGGQMDRAAQQGAAHQLPAPDGVGEGLPGEAGQTAPQRQIGRSSQLRLQADQTRDRGDRVEPLPRQEELPRQEGTAEGTRAQHHPPSIAYARAMPQAFVDELIAMQNELMAPMVGAGRLSLTQGTASDHKMLLMVALANEINVAELAAGWVATTPEIEVKLAFARQAGDEANHFKLVAARLTELGFDVAGFSAPAPSALFAYLRGLGSTVERIAAGLFTLEAIAYAVNASFMAYAAARGDDETVRIYRDCIQPDERAHQELGVQLLGRHAVSADERAAARATVSRVLELAGAGRAQAAQKLGVACFPGC